MEMLGWLAWLISDAKLKPNKTTSLVPPFHRLRIPSAFGRKTLLCQPLFIIVFRLTPTVLKVLNFSDL